MTDVKDLLNVIAQQQLQITALLNAHQVAIPAPIPSLPDVYPFELSDSKARIGEWLQRFRFALDVAAPGLKEEDKVKTLMNKLSPEAFSEYTKHCLPGSVTDHNLDATVLKLEKLFSRAQSLFLDRYELLKCSREDHEDFRAFINRHKSLLRDFQYDKMTKEQFNVLSLLLALKSPRDGTLRQRILTKLSQDPTTITYDSVVDDCLTFITTISESKMVENQSKSVNAFSKSKGKFQKKPAHQKNQSPAAKVQSNCWRCGGEHMHNECPHKDSVCRKCSKIGHLQSRCDAIQEWRKTHPYKGAKAKSKASNSVRIGTALKEVNSSSLLRTEVKLNKHPIQFCLDSGAEINIVDESTYFAIGKDRPVIHKCSEKAKLYDGSTRDFIGKGLATFEFNGIITKDEFYVAKKGALNLLGKETMDKFGLLDEIKRKIGHKTVNLSTKNSANDVNKFVASLPQNFPNVFREGLGLCTKMKAQLSLKPDATPVFRRSRPVPYNAKAVVDAEIDRLEAMGVLKSVEHAEWAAPILVVKKSNGSTRMCCDYSTGLNEALQDNKHPLPLPEDIFATLNGGKFFSTLDLRDAYFQIELEENSKKLCCIATHRGLYQLVRLPFGVKTAPSIFQAIMDSMLSGLSFAFAYLDDIIIEGKTVEEHKNNIEKVLERIKSFGFRLKLEKCDFFKEEIKYLGVIIDQNGRRPDPSKIKAIADMPAPHDVSSLRAFLGMVNHYQQFVKNMRFVRKPLDDMLKKEKKWSWDEKCKEAFEKIKKILSSDLLLTHYDPKQEIIVAADASDYGIGAVISHRFQDGSIKAVAHASSALNAAQQNYSQIEKEALALIFAIQKFHKYIFGRHFTLLTDHKPLLAIFGSKKGIRQCSANRLLRWSLMLLAYDFKIEYVNTLEFGQADALSRLIARSDDGENERVIATVDTETDMEQILNETSTFLPITFKDLASETAKDEILQKVIGFIKNGWPNLKQIQKENNELELFFRRKDELSLQNGTLLYAERVIIPHKFQKKVLEMLHKGHPGMKRMKQLARKFVYWPNIDKQIEGFVRNCEPCQSVARAPVKIPLHSWPKPHGPWTRVHVDYAGPFFGKDFLVIVDAYSKYPEVFEMKSKTASATIEKLRYLFSRHGLCETLVSDNGTQFQSCEFARFTAKNAIKHFFSAPYQPMSNGQAERFVDTFKRTFKKIKGEGVADPRIIETFLATYRTTPNDSLPEGKCPAELFLGRRPRTALDLLMPPPQIPYEKDEEMEKQFNRRFGTKPREYAIGDKVFARHRTSQDWRSGKVSKCNGVIYDIEFLDGSSNRFHANQLRSRKTADEKNEDLSIILGTFGLPLHPVVQANPPEIVNEVPPQPEIGIDGLEPEPVANVPEPVPNPIIQEQIEIEPQIMRKSNRNRHAPKRFSP